MRFLGFLIVLIFSLGAHGFQKVSDDFYVEILEDRDLTLVMERVKDEETRALWERYARKQDNKIWAKMRLKDRPRHFSDEGSIFFLSMLRQIPFPYSKLWVAYITKNPDPKPIQKDDLTENYGRSWRNSIGAIEMVDAGGDTPFTQNMMMVMTVNSVSDAPITSHMGIQKTVEGLDAGVKNISLPLHSFAARVMLDEDSSRTLMINAPVHIVAKMIAEALPAGAVALSRREDMDLRAKMQLSSRYTKIEKEWEDWPSLDIFEKYPPRLSYQTENMLVGRDWEKKVKGPITLYKEGTSDEVMMTFSETQCPEAYRVLCNNLSGVTYFIVVDLKALADFKPKAPS